MPDVSVNGISLHYEALGEGPPLVMIAGLASDSASWAPVAPLLSSKYRLVMADNRASGRTRANGPVTIPDIASDHVALLNQLDIEQADFYGHSMGGIIAMTIAAHYPERVNRIILSATAPHINEYVRSVVDTLVRLREAGAPEDDWYRTFFHWIFRPDFFADKKIVDASIALARAYPHKQSAIDMRRQVDGLRSYDARPLPEKIEAPALVLAASHDLWFPADEMPEAFTALANKQIKGIENSGHSMHWDQPAQIAALISEFLHDR